MQLEVFCLCDAATDSGHGRLNILGTFDTIWARQMPAVRQQCAVALRIRFVRIERREADIRINFVDADGNRIGPSPQLNVPVRFHDQLPSQAFNFIMNIQQLRFERFGEYQIDLAVNGRLESSLPLFVREMPAQSGGMQSIPHPEPDVEHD